MDQLFNQASRALNPVVGGTIYDQIDDQLWDQMVALPLFETPGLLANGVQITGIAYNPSEDGILWNVDQWTLLEAGPVPKVGVRHLTRTDPACSWDGWARRRATMPVAPIAISEPLRRSGGIGRRASLRG